MRVAHQTRALLGAVLLSLGATACADSHQRVYLQTDGLPLDPRDGFVDESDGLRITYSFHGHDPHHTAKGNVPIKVQITNTSAQPIRVDWSRSEVRIGGQTCAMVPPRTIVREMTPAIEAEYETRGYDNFTLEHRREYVSHRARQHRGPTRAVLQPGHTFYVLVAPWHPHLDLAGAVPVREEGITKTFRFEKDQTPLQFEVRLVTATDDGVERQHAQTFWVQEAELIADHPDFDFGPRHWGPPANHFVFYFYLANSRAPVQIEGCR
jgi:hypothetical protein